MKKLLDFLLSSITNSKDYSISGEEDSGGFNFVIKAPKESIGLIIGKNGRTIKIIRNLLKVRAILEKKLVTVSVQEA